MADPYYKIASNDVKTYIQQISSTGTVFILTAPYTCFGTKIVAFKHESDNEAILCVWSCDNAVKAGSAVDIKPENCSLLDFYILNIAQFDISTRLCHSVQRQARV